MHLFFVPIGVLLFVFGWMLACRALKSLAIVESKPRLVVFGVLGALVGALASWWWGPSGQAACGLVLFFFLCVIGFVDHDTRIIPNSLVLCVAALGLIVLVADLALPNGCLFPAVDVSWLDHVIGIFAASIPLLIIALITKGFGGGDIKLMAALGLVLGWKLVLLALVCGVVLGGIYAIVLLITKRMGLKGTFAFGPFLCVCAAFSCLFGDTAIALYLGMI